MAITQLAQGQTTLQNAAGAISTATQALVAGSNRLMLVVVGSEGVPPFTTLPTVAQAVSDVLPVVTWGGVPLSLVQRSQDGELARATLVNIASTAGISIVSRLSLQFFALREAEFAAMVGTQLDVSWPLTDTTFARNWRAGYWLLDDCDQAPRVRDFRTVTNDTVGSTSLAGATGPGGTSDAIILAGLKNESTGTLQLTIDGVGLAEDFEGSFAASGARFAGGKDLSAAALTGIPFSGAYTVQALSAGVILTAVRLAEFFSPTPGARSVVGSAPFGSSVVASDLIQTVSLGAQEP